MARIDGHQRTDSDVTDALVTDTGTLFLSQQDVIDAGATDVDWVGGVLEQVFALNEQQAFTAPPSSFLKRP